MKLTNAQLIIIGGTVLTLAVLLTIIIVTDRPVTTFVSALATVIPLIGGLFYLNQIKTQTNGTLSELRAELARERAVNTALVAAATPAQVEAAHDLVADQDTITRNTLEQIKEQ